MAKRQAQKQTTKRSRSRVLTNGRGFEVTALNKELLLFKADLETVPPRFKTTQKYLNLFNNVRDLIIRLECQAQQTVSLFSDADAVAAKTRAKG